MDNPELLWILLGLVVVYICFFWDIDLYNDVEEKPDDKSDDK